MPSLRSRSPSPTPESCSSCGELIAPPHRMISLARTRWTARFLTNSTPTARPFRKMIFVTNTRQATVRLLRHMTGCR